jgi:hypothetical protein
MVLWLNFLTNDFLEGTQPTLLSLTYKINHAKNGSPTNTQITLKVQA